MEIRLLYHLHANVLLIRGYLYNRRFRGFDLSNFNQKSITIKRARGLIDWESMNEDEGSIDGSIKSITSGNIFSHSTHQ